jgi:hypothetical protein
VHGLAQLLGGSRVRPAALGVSQRSDLGHDAQLVRIGMQGFLDDLVRHVRAVVVAGIDVGDAQLHRLAQHRHGGVTVLGRPEDAGAGELHGAVAHARDRQILAHGERSAGKCLCWHEKFLSSLSRVHPSRAAM